MDELIYLLLILLIFAVIVMLIVPLILLSKQSRTNQDLRSLENRLKESDEKLMYLINTIASKYDIDKIAELINGKGGVNVIQTTAKETPVEVKVPTKEVVKEPVVTVVEPVIVPQKEIKPVVEEIKPVVEEIKPDPIKPVVEPEPAIISEPERPIYATAENRQPEPTVKAKPIEHSKTAKVKAEKKSKEDDRNLFEKLVGENWLSKIGIITLVLGIGFFVKYAIDQNWINEIGRVGIGLLTGAIIVGIAHKLKEKYQVYSSILVGGGISVFYITITLAFREYEIFSQPVAFILLTVITIFSVLLSMLYNRQELAIFSYIGGSLSPLMISTGQGNYVVLFSFMLILNTGMLILSLKRSWKLIGIISYVVSLIFYFGWLLFKFDDQYLGATVFAVLFFAQYYILAIIKNIKEDKHLTIFQAVLIMTNNCAVLLATMYIFDDYELNIKGLVTLGIAVANVVVLVILFRRSHIDKNVIYLIIATVMALVSLAIPLQLDGYVITLFWSVETVLLLWLWQRSKINVFRLGFLLLSALVVVSYIMDATAGYPYKEHVTIIFNQLCITGIVVLLSFVLNLFLLKKEDSSSIIKFRKTELFSVATISMIFKYIFVLLLFTVPYLELNHQLKVSEYSDNLSFHESHFRSLVMATYTTLFVAGLAMFSRNKMNTFKFWFFALAAVLYAIVYINLTCTLRFDIVILDYYSKGHFAIHLLSLPGIGYIVWTLINYVKTNFSDRLMIFGWGLVILSTIILSYELDNLIIWLFGNPNNYHSLLDDVHTVGYPILWGLIAMTLMIYGLKYKNAVLRKISIISFGLIILKFYALDVWDMSQSGRIISFVILGVILLGVSFLQQKIKTLVKEDEPSTTELDRDIE